MSINPDPAPIGAGSGFVLLSAGGGGSNWVRPPTVIAKSKNRPLNGSGFCL